MFTSSSPRFCPAVHNVRIQIVSDAQAGSGITEQLACLGFRFDQVTQQSLPSRSATFSGRGLFVVQLSDNRDGLGIIRMVRRFFPEAGVIATTDTHEEALHAQLLEAGADSTIVLPCDSQLLKAKLDALTRRMLSDWSPDGDEVHLSAENCAVRIHGNVARLRPTEFKICEYLVMNRGRWVGEREILRHVLETFHDRETSLVRVHVRHIRKALGALATCIQTKRGVGYRFEMPPQDRGDCRAS